MTQLSHVLDSAQKGWPINREDAEAILNLEDISPDLLDAAGKIGESHLGRELRFYYPLPRFPNVSVTGARCALRCKHCGGHYLEAMVSVETPSKLKTFGAKLEARGGIGLLVSGGSDSRGRVPLEPFLGALSWIKENTDLIVNVHAGLLDSREAEGIASTGIDIASMDLVGSDETIRNVYGLNARAEDYYLSLEALKEAGVPHVVPHICVGLDFGTIRGEAAALQMVQRLGSAIIVILGMIPTQGTQMEAVSPPSAWDMAKVVAAARLMAHGAEIALGCMRPRADKARAEELAIMAGANRIVLPTRSTVYRAEKKGFRATHLDGCCSIPRSLERPALRGTLREHGFI